jgi:hypothetical protein
MPEGYGSGDPPPVPVANLRRPSTRRRRTAVAVVMKMHWAGVTPEQYDQVREHVGWEEEPAEGGLFHVAWFADGGLNVVDVWESPERFGAFAESRLNAATAAAGIDTEPDVDFQPVHRAWNPEANRAFA